MGAVTSKKDVRKLLREVLVEIRQRMIGIALDLLPGPWESEDVRPDPTIADLHSATDAIATCAREFDFRHDTGRNAWRMIGRAWSETYYSFFSDWFGHVRARIPVRLVSPLNPETPLELLAESLSPDEWNRLWKVLKQYAGTTTPRDLQWLAEFRRWNLEDEGLDSALLDRLASLLADAGLELRD